MKEKRPAKTTTTYLKACESEAAVGCLNWLRDLSSRLGKTAKKKVSTLTLKNVGSDPD
jgi:hypothetical protein